MLFLRPIKHVFHKKNLYVPVSKRLVDALGCPGVSSGVLG